MKRVAVGNDFDVTATFYNGETPTDADTTPVLTIVDAVGNTVAHGAVTSLGSGAYTAKVEARSEVDELTATWAAAVNSYDVKYVNTIAVDGSYLFQLYELRDMEGMADSERFPTDVLEIIRDEVTTFINDFTRTAFVPTFYAETQDGRAGNTLLSTRVPLQRVLSATVNGTDVDTSAFTAAADGRIRSSVAWTSTRTQGQGVVIRYVYGRSRGVPSDLKRAALMLGAQWLRRVDSQIPDRARQMITQWGTYQLATATEEYPTGYPEIDSVLCRYSWRVPFIG